MKRTLLSVAVLAAIGMFCGTFALAGATNSVTIENDSFNPKSIAIESGQTVTFTNKDDEEHTVAADDKSFDSKPLSADGHGNFRYKFTKPGRYAYHCSIHPFMHGVIIVK